MKDPVLPDYGGECLTNIVPAIFSRLFGPSPNYRLWHDQPIPALAEMHSKNVVLLVLDGLGWNQLKANRDTFSSFGSFKSSPITSVAPTTTSSALTSITTGLAPLQHGIVGYRMHMGQGDVMNVLRWSVAGKDVRSTYPPTLIQSIASFGGMKPAMVTRTEFGGTGFTQAHLYGARLTGWRVASSIAVEVSNLVKSGEKFVYVYYDGIDKVAHEYGFGSHYLAELRAVDRIVGDILEVLPSNTALVVTADHGQVQVDQDPIVPNEQILGNVRFQSGEGRWRWFHVKPGSEDEVIRGLDELYGGIAWIRSKRQIIDEMWLGSAPTHEVAGRLGDVALIAKEPVAFFDPSDTGELKLICRHGSLSEDEIYVPLMVFEK